MKNYKTEFLVDLGIETCLHYLYKNKDIKSYESYANGLDYKTKNDILTKLIHNEAEKISLKGGTSNKQTYRWYVLNEIFSEIAQVVVRNHIHSMQSNITVKNVHWGDNSIFSTDGKNYFIFLDPQSLIRRLDTSSGNVILTPICHDLYISESRFDLLDGFDIGAFMYRVIEATRTQIEIYTFKLKEHARETKDIYFKIVFEGDISFYEHENSSKSGLTIQMQDRYAIGAAY